MLERIVVAIELIATALTKLAEANEPHPTPTEKEPAKKAPAKKAPAKKAPAKKAEAEPEAESAPETEAEPEAESAPETEAEPEAEDGVPSVEDCRAALKELAVAKGAPIAKATLIDLGYNAVSEVTPEKRQEVIDACVKGAK